MPRKQLVEACGSAFLLRILAAWADLRGTRNQNRPAAFIAVNDGLAQHASDHRAAAPAAAGTGADAGAFADLLEGFRAGLNRFAHGAFADLVAQALGDRQQEERGKNKQKGLVVARDRSSCL